MAHHKPFLQALVDIKGSSENLSLTVKSKEKNNTAKAHNRLQLSVWLQQKCSILYIVRGTLKCEDEMIVSTCCLVGTLSLPGEECHSGL